MKNLFKKQSKKKIPDEITARQVSFKVLKKKTSFEATDRRESTNNNCIQQTHSDAAKFLQRMESIGEVHLEFNNEDMHQDLDLIHRRKSRVSSSNRQYQSRKTRGRRSPGEEQFLSSKRDNGIKREGKQSQRNVMTAPIHKLEKMDLHGGHDPRTRPRSGSSSNHHQNRDMAAGKMTAVSQAFPKNTDSRPVRKAVSKRGSMDVCLGFEDSGSEVSNSKDVYSPPPRKRRSLDMTDAASEDIVQPDLHSMDVDPRIASLHTDAHKMQKQQFEDRRRMQQDPRNIGTIDNNIKPESTSMHNSRQTVDAEMMNRKRMLQKQVSMPDAPRQMSQQHFIKQQSMRQFSKAEHEARQVQLLQRHQFTKQQVMPQSSRSELESRPMAAQRPQMMKQHSVKHISIPVQDQRLVIPKQKSFRNGTEAPVQLTEQHALQQSHKQFIKEQHRQDPNRRSLVQDTVQDLQAQFQQTANVWDEINSQQVSMQQSNTIDIDNQQQPPEGKINNMNIASRSRVFQQEQQQPRNNMKPDHISAIPTSKERLMQRDQNPVKSMQNEQVLIRPDQISAIPIRKESSKERLMQRDQNPVKSMQNEQVLMRPDQISAIPIKKPSSRDRFWQNNDQIPFQSMQNEQVLIKKRLQPPRTLESTVQSLQKEQSRHQGQISNQQLRGSPTMQMQRHPNEKEQLQTTTAQTDKPNLHLVRNNSSMLRARNSRFHKMQKQQSVRTYQSNSSSESSGKDVRTKMIRNSRMTGQSTRTFESNSSSESRESARQSAQVSHYHAQNNKRDEIIEQMTIVKRRPTLKRSSMDTSLAIIQDL